MKLPELPDLDSNDTNNSEENKSSSVSGLPNLGNLEDNKPKRSNSQADFEDSIKMPDLFDVDDELKPKETQASKDGFGDIPIGSSANGERLEPNRMFEDLPINAEFEEPQLFGDIPVGNDGAIPASSLDSSLEMPPITFDTDDLVSIEPSKPKSNNTEDMIDDLINDSFDNLQEIGNTESIQEDNQKEEYEMNELEKEVERYRDEEKLKISNDEYSYGENEDYLDELEVDEEEVEGEFGFLPGIDLDEDVEQFDGGLFGGIEGFDEDEVYDEDLYPESDEDHDSNEVDEEKIKEFFSNLKSKITSAFSNVKNKAKSNKKDKSDKVEKPKDIAKDKNKIKDSKEFPKDKIIGIIKYVVILIAFVALALFAINKLGIIGGGYKHLEEISQNSKVSKTRLLIENAEVSENKLSVSILNEEDEFTEFTMSAEVFIKNESGKEEFYCNDTIMSIAPSDSMNENMKCEGLPEHEEGNSYKIKFNIEEL